MNTLEPSVQHDNSVLDNILWLNIWQPYTCGNQNPRPHGGSHKCEGPQRPKVFGRPCFAFEMGAGCLTEPADGPQLDLHRFPPPRGMALNDQIGLGFGSPVNLGVGFRV